MIFVRIDVYVLEKDFYWLSCDLMETTNFPQPEAKKQVPGGVTIGYANTIKETLAKQIILGAYFEGIDDSKAYEFAGWLYDKLQKYEVKALHIAKKPVQIRTENIAAVILEESPNIKE